MRRGLVVLFAATIFTGLTLLTVSWSGQETPTDKYHDTRERLATTLTFEWNVQIFDRITAERVEEINKQAPPELYVDPVAAANKTYIREGQFIIRRQPEATHIESLVQPFMIQNVNLDIRDRRSFYFLEDAILAFMYDPFRPSELARVDLVRLDNSIELADLNRFYVMLVIDTINTNALPFLMGTSPFRLLSASPQDWRLKRVSPEEWVFELQEDRLSKKAKATIHLDRRYGDAPSLIKIEDGRRSYTLRARKFRRVEGVWFPSEFEEEVKDNISPPQFAVYTLLNVYETKEKTIEVPAIPAGTLTYVHQLKPESVGKTSLGEETRWSDDLLPAKRAPRGEASSSGQ